MYERAVSEASSEILSGLIQRLKLYLVGKASERRALAGGDVKAPASSVLDLGAEGPVYPRVYPAPGAATAGPFPSCKPWPTWRPPASHYVNEEPPEVE